MNYKERYRPSLGLVATGKRRLKPGKLYDGLIPKPSKADPIINLNGTVMQTVSYCKNIVRKTLLDTRSIAPLLKKSTLDETCKAIYDFVFNHIQYEIDKPTVEQLRRPARLWADKKGDCDCFSITISSILSNLGIPHFFRIIKLYNRSYYQHIYVIVPKPGATDMNVRSNYYVIDPVLDKYDMEAPKITAKTDTYMEKLNGMPIQFLNGVGKLPFLIESGDAVAQMVQRPNGMEVARAPRAKTKSRFGPDGRRGDVSGLTLGREFEGLEGLDVTDQELGRIFLSRMKQHLVNTRAAINKNPRRVSRLYQVRPLAAAYDELIGAWDNETRRDQVLEKLSATEESLLRPEFQGLGDIIHGPEEELFGLINGNFRGLSGSSIRRQVTGLGKATKKTGVFTKVKNATKKVTNITKKVSAPIKKTANKVQTAVGKKVAPVLKAPAKIIKNTQAKTKNVAAKTKVIAQKAGAKTKEAVKKVGKAIAKYNPVSLAARAGFLVAMKTNFGKIASRVYWGAFTQAEAQKAGVKAGYWVKSKSGYDRVVKTFVNTLKGDESSIRKAIITGRAAKKLGMKGVLNGLDQISGLNGGLGVATEASITAAMAFLTPLLTFVNQLFKKGNGKEETETGGEMPATSDDPTAALTQTDPGPTVKEDNATANYNSEVTEPAPSYARTSAPASTPAPGTPEPSETSAPSAIENENKLIDSGKIASGDESKAWGDRNDSKPEAAVNEDANDKPTVDGESKAGIVIVGAVAALGMRLWLKSRAADKKKDRKPALNGPGKQKLKTIKIK